MEKYENLLYDKIKSYTDSEVVPMHMPGHKRSKDLPNILPFDIDITEIDGFDNLHDMEGILKDASDKASKVFRVKKSYFLINGSSGGILSAIYSQTAINDNVIVARNSHKAVYNALELAKLNATYIMPKFDAELNINGEIDSNELSDLLNKNKGIKCVVITSPTYEGIVSNIKAIAEVCHAHNALLIVDEAHGAHLGFSEHFPESARNLGADIVINSLHKTLPTLTQCAILHVCSDRVNTIKLEKALAMFETSSPSYILMSSIDYCINLLKNDSNQLFNAYSENLDTVYSELKDLKHLKLLNFKGNANAYDFDKGKLIISAKNAEISGKTLAQILREKHKIEVEMASINYIIAMTSICDSKHNFNRFIKAIKAIDKEIENNNKATDTAKNLINQSTYFDSVNLNDNKAKQNLNKNKNDNKAIYKDKSIKNEELNFNVSGELFSPPQNLPIYKCKDLQGKLYDIKDCIGKTALEFIWLYPPGIPMLVSGEIITKEFIERLNELDHLGLEIKSNFNKAPKQIYCKIY